MLAQSTAASLKLGGRFDSVSTIVTGENPSDCRCLQSQASISKENICHILCNFVIKKREFERFLDGTKIHGIFLSAHTLPISSSEAEGSADSQVYLNGNTIKNHFMMRKY